MKPRVLVVDDEPIVRKFIEAALGRHGYQVRLASCVAEAEQVFGQGRGGIDLLLTEAELPDGSGVALTAGLRGWQGGLPVVYMSGQASVETQEKVLRKPFTTDALLSALLPSCCQHPKAA